MCQSWGSFTFTHMNFLRASLVALASVATASAGVALAMPAHATNTTPKGCDLSAWYVNPDETDRHPVTKQGGFEFSGNDLIHHATSLDVKDLHPGTFHASATPDQTSFFSVEVSGSDGGYGTLRWNTATSKWNLTTGGQFYENTSAEALADMPAAHRSHKVVSFGVGYTNSPPGTVTTLVSSVRFRGHTYPMFCKQVPTHKPHPTPSCSTKVELPPVVVKGRESHPHPSCSASPSASASTSPSASASTSTSASPSASVSTSASASASASTSHSPSASTTTTTHTTSPTPSHTAIVPAGNDTSLPVTGPGGIIAACVGALLLIGGAMLVVMSRRRKTRFTA